jgi:hypothetical protein
LATYGVYHRDCFVSPFHVPTLFKRQTW